MDPRCPGEAIYRISSLASAVHFVSTPRNLIVWFVSKPDLNLNLT